MKKSGMEEVSILSSKITLEPTKIQTREFLSAFFENEEEIYFRIYPDKKDDSFKGGKEKCLLCNYSKMIYELKKNNEMNRAISFVVNGGGNTDKEVIRSKCCKAQFMEIDDFPMNIQIAIINNFPIIPSIVVKTKKSLHTYWLLKDGDINRFRGIQSKLIELFNSDPKIQNESRVMRLPGFYHNKEEPIMVEVIHFRPELIYSQDEIENVLKDITFEKLLENAELSDEDKEKVLEKYESCKKEKKVSRSVLTNNNRSIDSNRVMTLVSEVSKMKKNGFNNSIIRGAIETMNSTMCNPPLSPEELESQVFPTLDRWESEPLPIEKIVEPKLLDKIRYYHPESNAAFKWNDKGNGALFAELFKDCIRWNSTAKEWYYYDGKIWSIDRDGMIAKRCAKQLFDALIIYSIELENNFQGDHKIVEEYRKFIEKLGYIRARKVIIEDAKDLYYITNDMLDKNKYLLNLQNGILDLKNFTLLKHDPEKLLSKICNVKYDPDAKGERWLKFLNEIMQGNQEKINYLQKILGYALTGDTKEETCYILYGKSTRNGKSTLVETIGYLLGESTGYAMNIRPETLAVKRNTDSRQASSDIARLKDCRFLNAAEPPKRMIFDVGLLKTMLGRDQITARFLHENEFQFVPCFKLFINTNHLPLINDDTLFGSGRINVITFDRHFEESEQDKGLKDALIEEGSLSGILNWCIDGLKKYYEEGAEAPDCVKAATFDYRSSSDKIGSFLEECFEKNNYCNTSGKIAYNKYKEWCDDNGFGSENLQNFYAELRSKGVLVPSGTINGKTQRNVLSGYKVINYYVENPKKEEGFFEVNEQNDLPFKE